MAATRRSGSACRQERVFRWPRQGKLFALDAFRTTRQHGTITLAGSEHRYRRPVRPASEELSDQVPHRSFRGSLMPLATGLATVIAVLGPLGPAGALAAVRAPGGGVPGDAGGTIRAQEWWLTALQVTQVWRTSEGAGVTVAVLGTGVAA